MVQIKIYKLVSLFIIIFIGVTIIINTNNDIYNNEFTTRKKIVPNLVHYVIFNQYKINFDMYLSIISVLKFQKPDKIIIHSNQNLSGQYWDKIKGLNYTKTLIVVNFLSMPTHVFGQKLSSVFHASDVARILVLQELGGIYLDADVLVLKNLDTFRDYDMVVGWPEKEFIGTQVLLAVKNAEFLKLWLHGYKRYIPFNWYYNAGKYPTEQILEKMPHLAHRVKKLFGVQNLLEFLYESHDLEAWKEFYTVHLLSRHLTAVDFMKESMIGKMNNTFGEIVDFILKKNTL